MISVVILNYNGNDVVFDCLASVLSLDWDDLEVLVVDNASTDGSPERIVAEFGDRVHVVRRRLNSPTAGRNEGFAVARGEYVLSLDNDIVLPDATVLRKAANHMEKVPSAGALCFCIGSCDCPDEPLPEHWWHPVPLKTHKNRFFFTDWFPEGAVLFRRSALSATGGYNEDLFQGYEAADFSLRLLDLGFEILYCPDLCSVELRIRGMHYPARREINYLFLRNKLWTAWINYPLGRAVLFGAMRIAIAGIRAARFGWIDLWLRAVGDGLVPSRSIRNKRRPLGPLTWKHIRRIRKGQFGQEITCLNSVLGR